MKTMYECTIDELRDAGYAIVIFTPEELDGADPDRVEENLVSTGWDIISIHAQYAKEEESEQQRRDEKNGLYGDKIDAAN